MTIPRMVLVLMVLTAALAIGGAHPYSACGDPTIRTAPGAVMCCCQQTFGGTCCKMLEGVCPPVVIPGCQCPGLSATATAQISASHHASRVAGEAIVPSARQ
jgi:hypothetical protein